jgi:two-component system cell cycle sensor histidine kinase/response regulator CckA
MSVALVPLIVGPVLLVPLAMHAFRQRHVRGAMWYGGLLLAIACWSALYAVELRAVDLADKILALKLKYVGVVALPITWIGFILDFVGRDRAFVRRVVGPMLVAAAVALAFAWTNEWHGLFWGHITLLRGATFTLLVGRGPGFWINIVYTYCLLWAGIGILIAQAVQSPFLYRTRAIVIVLATLLPWLGNVVFLSRAEDLGGVDATPFLFACTAVLAAVAVFRYRVLDPIPTLRDARIEVIGDGVLIVDGTGRVADLNRAAERQLGRGRAAATGQPLPEVLAGCPVLAPSESRGDVTVARNGDRRIYDVRVTPIPGRGERLAGHVVLLSDVTERRQAETALAESERRYRDLVENARDLIVTCEPGGRILSVNDAGLRMMGRARDAVVGRSLADLVAPHSREVAVAVLAAAASGSSASPAEIELVTHGGGQVTLELSSWLQQDRGERIVQAIGRDISERRRLEGQLREAQKMEAVGKLAGGVAHDFNNLLTSIIGFATLAEGEVPGDSPTRGWLTQIRRSGEHAATVTRQLLAFGRRQLLHPVALDLNRTVRDLEVMLRCLVGEDIRLVTTLADDVEPVRADVAQVEQVIVNLIVNARDAMPGGGDVTIRTGRLEAAGPSVSPPVDLPPGRYVALAVSDSGDGIPADVLSHIFEPFYTTKAFGRGAGLGLATVYGIVKQSAGDIFVETAPGRGSTFTVFLPVATDVEPPASSSATAAVRPAGATVLVVEDDPGVRQFAEEVLTGAGWRVLAAPGPHEAIDLVSSGAAVDLLLTDVVMPGMSGGALAEHLVALRPGLPVLFMSGYSDEDVMGRGGIAPGRGVLEKPFTAGELRRRVEQLLELA